MKKNSKIILVYVLKVVKYVIPYILGWLTGDSTLFDSVM